ncbi:UNVERIFIED_CONTAM: hypothetical protein FKN15_075482 [Acipenser sinensis]
MTSNPWFHACTSCKANMPPRVRRNRLRRAMGIDIQSPTAEPSKALRAPSLLLQLSQSPSQEISCAQAPVPKPCSCSPSPQMRRVKCSRQASDVIYLKEKMAQVLELLSRQQAPAELEEVPAPLPPSPASAPGSTMGAQAKPEPQPLMAEEDTLYLVASWDEDSFPIEMEEEEEPAPSIAWILGSQLVLPRDEGFQHVQKRTSISKTIPSPSFLDSTSDMKELCLLGQKLVATLSPVHGAFGSSETCSDPSLYSFLEEEIYEVDGKIEEYFAYDTKEMLCLLGQKLVATLSPVHGAFGSSETCSDPSLYSFLEEEIYEVDGKIEEYFAYDTKEM